MESFPTLSQGPDVTPWEEGVAADPTIRTEFESGYVETRPSFTRIPDAWHIGYTVLPVADKNSIRAFEKTVKVGSDSWTWTNPDDGVARTVRFLGKVKYKMDGSKLFWNVEFDIEEV